MKRSLAVERMINDEVDGAGNEDEIQDPIELEVLSPAVAFGARPFGARTPRRFGGRYRRDPVCHKITPYVMLSAL